MTISQILQALGIPVCHTPYLGSERKYVTYQFIGQDGILYAEGREQETGTMYAVNVYAERKDVFTLMQEVKTTLESADYIVTVDTEIYEETEKLHRIVLTAVREGAVYG